MVVPKVFRRLSVPRPRDAPPSSRDPKYMALLIGINYTSNKSTADPNGDFSTVLKGPVNDVKKMKDILISAQGDSITTAIYKYREEDIFLMTDEERNEGTDRWPSKPNIIKAMHLFVKDASSEDAFVFHYAGHSGQQKAKKDPNEIDGKDEYILACDGEIILDDDLRKYLVDKLKPGAILDACHSGTLLDLNHYNCHWFLRKRNFTLDVEKAEKLYTEPPKRSHSDGDAYQLMYINRPIKRTFSVVAKFSLAVVLFKFLKAKRAKEAQGSNTVRDNPIPVKRPPCGGWYCAYSLKGGPLVISVSACSDHESALEDRKRNGSAMTMELITILTLDSHFIREKPKYQSRRAEPRRLSLAAFNRVKKARKIFKRWIKKKGMSPDQRSELEEHLAKGGHFEFREQTLQARALNGGSTSLSPF
ncbi:caspase domain-containing protein [Gloeopeniophorella convolvens]|nr:caspase domain-containing protein [Gloeopeniophorella convolvens]